MTAPCTHGMPTPAACWTCMEDGNLEPPERPQPPRRAGTPLRARYPGHCDGCNTAIHEAEPIVRTTHGTYQHDRCIP